MSHIFDNMASPFKCGLSEDGLNAVLEPLINLHGHYNDSLLDLPLGSEDINEIMEMPLGDEEDLFLTLPEGDMHDTPTPVEKSGRLEPAPAEESSGMIFKTEDIEDINDVFPDIGIATAEVRRPIVESPSLTEDPEDGNLFDDLLRNAPASAARLQDEPTKVFVASALATIPIPDPDPSMPWIEPTQARINAIDRARESVVVVSRREIDDIIRTFEGGGGDKYFPKYAERLKAGGFLDNKRAAQFLNFYFAMRFATFDLRYAKIEAYVWLWRYYGKYIPEATLRESAERLKRDPKIIVCPSVVFQTLWARHSRLLAEEITKREREWEQAESDLALKRRAAHDKKYDAIPRDIIDAVRLAEVAERQAEARTAYRWQSNLNSNVFHYYSYGKTTDQIYADYMAVCAEIKQKLKEYL